MTATGSKNSKQSTIVVGIGEIVWDIFPDGPRLGGAPANFAYYAKVLGRKAILVSRVGNDELGKRTLSLLSGQGLLTDHVQVHRSRPTGTVKVVLDSTAVPVFTIQENVAWDYLEPYSGLQAIAREVSAVCFGSLAFRSAPNRETISWFLNQVRPDCLRVLDINLRPPFYSKDLVNSLLGLADVLKANEEELNIIGSMFFPSLYDETQALERLLSNYGMKLIALTKGRKGSRLITADGESYHPGFAVDVVDTVGAGDAFTAALVDGLLSGESLAEINEKANRLASMVCAQKGAWAEVEFKGNKGKKKGA